MYSGGGAGHDFRWFTDKHKNMNSHADYLLSFLTHPAESLWEAQAGL